MSWILNWECLFQIEKKKSRPKIWIYKDKETGRQKGEATVTYIDTASAVAAIEQLNGKRTGGVSVDCVTHGLFHESCFNLGIGWTPGPDRLV